MHLIVQVKQHNLLLVLTMAASLQPTSSVFFPPQFFFFLPQLSMLTVPWHSQWLHFDLLTEVVTKCFLKESLKGSFETCVTTGQILVDDIISCRLKGSDVLYGTNPVSGYKVVHCFVLYFLVTISYITNLDLPVVAFLTCVTVTRIKYSSNMCHSQFTFS